ncbi:MAG: chorismate synthase [Nitrospinota bacterium]|jgi:chorismate synthase|nr:chorismate synthase [Nitrospinota bacterium]MDP7581147.1 chorismate synthase [Nitrospinota bacterium]HJN02760.1 chorismate synthase [Nitrospinota bacterium]
MAGNSFGDAFRITTWGESHGPAIGVVIDGCPAGIPLKKEGIQNELNRRSPGQSSITTSRKEPDKVEILAGLFDGITTGQPISLLIKNQDVDSSKYEKIKNLFRPGHADFTYLAKYGIRDYRGGGRSSARETTARVACGAVAKKILQKNKIAITGHTVQIGFIKAEKFSQKEIEKNPVRCADKKAAQKMVNEIRRAKKAGDSLGGIVEVIAKRVPPGLGEPVFDKLDADIAKAMMSLGSVKGIEIGNGFAVSSMKGSEANDELIVKSKRISTKTNHAGGIVGGISNGNDIIVRLAVKPTASIAQEQRTVNRKGRPKKINVEGRHDPCICPRIVPIAESMLALVLADHLLKQKIASIK